MSRPAVNNLTMSDGHNLVALAWPWQRVDAPRAHVLLVHGLGEHANRYNALAAWLQQQGISVWAYDQRGHGASDGARGVLPKSDTLLTDLDSVWQSFARAHTDGAPLLVLGHSMGGLVAMRWLQRGPIIGSAAAPLAAIVSSPVLGVHARRLEQHLARILAQYVPNIQTAKWLEAWRLVPRPSGYSGLYPRPLGTRIHLAEVGALVNQHCTASVGRRCCLAGTAVVDVCRRRRVGRL